jgi:hypothetical protein
MRKQNLLKLLLPLGVLLVVCSLFIQHFTQLSEPFIGFLRGLGITLVVAYFLKASLTKTVW